MENAINSKTEMVSGQIYFISFGGNTQLIVRYKDQDACNYNFFSCVHYWNSYESFNKSDYCVKHGIDQIREATKAEQYTLFRFEVKDLPIKY